MLLPSLQNAGVLCTLHHTLSRGSQLSFLALAALFLPLSNNYSCYRTKGICSCLPMPQRVQCRAKQGAVLCQKVFAEQMSLLSVFLAMLCSPCSVSEMSRGTAAGAERGSKWPRTQQWYFFMTHCKWPPHGQGIFYSAMSFNLSLKPSKRFFFFFSWWWRWLGGGGSN